MAESLEIPSSDFAAMIDKCIKHALESPDPEFLEIKGLYLAVSPEDLSTVSRRLQQIAYGDAWVTKYHNDYSTMKFAASQKRCRAQLKMMGISFERADDQS